MRSHCGQTGRVRTCRQRAATAFAPARSGCPFPGNASAAGSQRCSGFSWPSPAVLYSACSRIENTQLRSHRDLCQTLHTLHSRARSSSHVPVVLLDSGPICARSRAHMVANRATIEGSRRRFPSHPNHNPSLFSARCGQLGQSRRGSSSNPANPDAVTTPVVWPAPVQAPACPTSQT